MSTLKRLQYNDLVYGTLKPVVNDIEDNSQMSALIGASLWFRVEGVVSRDFVATDGYSVYKGNRMLWPLAADHTFADFRPPFVPLMRGFWFPESDVEIVKVLRLHDICGTAYRTRPGR